MGTVPTTFGSNAFTVTIPLSLIGESDGTLNVAGVFGNTTGPTDCVPNGGFLGLYRLYLPTVLKSV